LAAFLGVGFGCGFENAGSAKATRRNVAGKSSLERRAGDINFMFYLDKMDLIFTGLRKA